MSKKCTTCGQTVDMFDQCLNCLRIEQGLSEYLESPKGQDFVRNLLPKLDNWPEWDYEAVLKKHEITVEQGRKYWWPMSWRHGSIGLNTDDEVIARKCAALFAELFLRGVTCSFADNLAHGFAMWLELQNQRYSFELTEDLGDAVLKMNSCRNTACMSNEEAAWDKLVESARLLRERE